VSARLIPASLTGRLVATLVALVATVCVAIAVVTTLAMRHSLYDQLDQQVAAALDRVEHAPPDAGTIYLQHQGGGTVVAAFAGGQSLGGAVLTDSGARRALSTTDYQILGDVPADGHGHTVKLPALGGFRMLADGLPDGSTLLTGLSTHGVEASLGNLFWTEALLTIAALGVAAVAGDQLVRRQLRPLRDVAATAHEVTALPLESGEIGETVRVPERLTDPTTEVGQVGSALNTMLAHVESALDARHRSEQQVRQFVGDASHELRTPLSTIHGYAELSRRTPDDAVLLTQAMAKVESEAHRMSVLVDDLLLLARLDAGRPLERAQVDLTRLALEAVADARVVSADHHWRLDLGEEPVTVEGDEQRLHQVVMNLLTNARMHTPAGSVVTAGVKPGETGAVLTVHDDGPGVGSELADRVFERFTRGDSARARASGGSGLGLSLVEAIVTAHGGTVAVASVPGDTTFTVTLP
jgi:two-component system OmpR family sensor kinase